MFTAASSVRYLCSLWIGVGVKLAANSETSRRSCVRDEIDNDLVTYQRFSSPVFRDEREESVLDLVPFTCSGREMTHGDLHPEFVRKILQFHFPESNSGPVATAGISGYQQFLRIRIALLPQVTPPSPYGFHGKGRGIVVSADAYPCLVLAGICTPRRERPCLIACR